MSVKKNAEKLVGRREYPMKKNPKNTEVEITQNLFVTEESKGKMKTAVRKNKNT